MSRFFFNFIITFLSLSPLFNHIYGIRVEPRVTSLLPPTSKTSFTEAQICVLQTLKQLVSSNGRIPPKITKKRLQQAVIDCRTKLTLCEYPTIVEETIYLLLGQYGHLSEINSIKTLTFINDIQKDSTTTVQSYTRMYKLSQNSQFCKLYDDFISSAYPKEYNISFLPEDGERCLELLKRLRQNAFYTYWGQGGVVADQAQPIVDDKVSNEPIKTKDVVISNSFSSHPSKENPTEATLPESSDNQSINDEQKEYERVILSKNEIEQINTETDDKSGCCSSCSCCSSNKKSKETKKPQKVVDNSMTEEELELMKLEEELEKEKSGCCSSCSSNKKSKKDKKESTKENKVNEAESLEDIVGVPTNTRKLEMEAEKEKEKEKKSSCSCSCCCSNGKKKSENLKEDEYQVEKQETNRKEEQSLTATVENTMTEEELELMKLEEELEKEKSGCCSSCSSKKKSKKDKKAKKNKAVGDEEDLNPENENQEEDSYKDKNKKDKKDKKGKKDKKNKEKESQKKQSETGALASGDIFDEELEEKKSGSCSSCSCSSNSKGSKDELKNLEELERKLEEEEILLKQKKSEMMG